MRTPGDISQVRGTHCARGHEYTQENTYMVPGTSYTYCRECHREKERIRRKKKRARQERSGGESE